MLGSQLRGVLRRPEFNGDVLLSLNRPSFQQRGRVTPLANSVLCGRKKSSGAAQELYVLHLAKLPYRGSDPYGLSCPVAITRRWITRPTEGNKFAGFQSCRPMSQRRPGLRRNENGELRRHG